MDLSERWIGGVTAAVVEAIIEPYVRVPGLIREVVGVAVAARRQDDRVALVAFDLPRQQVAHDDATGVAVDNDQIEHLPPGEGRYGTGVHLAHHRLVGAKQELLAGLAAGVESS